jgi:hypothetical protein
MTPDDSKRGGRYCRPFSFQLGARFDKQAIEGSDQARQLLHALRQAPVDAVPLGHGLLSSRVCLLQFLDVEFLHLHDRLQDSIRPRRIRIAQHFG